MVAMCACPPTSDTKPQNNKNPISTTLPYFFIAPSKAFHTFLYYAFSYKNTLTQLAMPTLQPEKKLSLSVSCYECSMTASVAETNSDNVRFYTTNGAAVRFGANVTQAKIDAHEFRCECCQDDYDDENDY